jgi:hypothetical protein
MHDVADIRKKIERGERLILAGDEKLLGGLPEGDWIAGSIPYFMTEDGGAFIKDRIFATAVPPFATECEIKTYDARSIKDIYRDAPENGLSVVIIPSASPTHLEFALNVASFEGFASRPLIGWISGGDLGDPAAIRPKVFSGGDPSAIEDGAAVMHISLPTGKVASIDTVNIFEQGRGDTIIFPEEGFSATDVLVNGERTNFADYLAREKADARFPLVADYYGALINVSFLDVDAKGRRVTFYAPVFKGVEYKLAAPITDYAEAFTRRVPEEPTDTIFFSCNCILNYLYSELAGKKTDGLTGPITFGEIAYLLLNQTLVYASIRDARPDIRIPRP